MTGALVLLVVVAVGYAVSGWAVWELWRTRPGRRR